jgi:hypothetical protein
MAGKKSKSKDTPYRERNTERSPQTGNIDARNNNETADPFSGNDTHEPNIGVSNTGMGDSSVDNNRLTNFTSNHSADA